jgi:hypothetical protein
VHGGTFSVESGQISGTSSGQPQVFGMFPIEGSNTVLAPRAVDFFADPSQTLPLPTGHVVLMHTIQPQSIVFSVTAAVGFK